MSDADKQNWLNQYGDQLTKMRIAIIGSNGFIGSIPKNPVLKMCIDYIVNIIKETGPDDKVIVTNISGPGCLGININKYLNREWNTSFVGKEGIINDIKFLKFNSMLKHLNRA